jgi:hypothetical protein
LGNRDGFGSLVDSGMLPSQERSNQRRPKPTMLREICRWSESLQVFGAGKKSVKVHYVCCEPKQWILQKGDSDSCLRMYFIMNILAQLQLTYNLNTTIIYNQ